MAFVLKQDDRFTWPISFDVPVDGGRHQRQSFDGEFVRVSQSRLRELGEAIQNDEMNDSDIARQVLVGWSGITDDEGEEVPFSKAAVDRLLDVRLISCLGLTGSEGKGSKKRVYRVIHPSYVEAQRAAIEVMGEEWLPSKRARALRAG